MNMFRYDHIFFRIFEKIADAFLITFFWLVCSLPFFTAGAATAALYDTVRKNFRRDEGYVFQTFKKSFQNNFRQGTKLWLCLCALLLLFRYEKRLVYDHFLSKGSMFGLLYYFFFAAVFFTIIWTIFSITYLAHFEDGIKTILKNTALILVGNLPWSALMLFLFLIAAVIIYIVPFCILIVPVPLFFLYDIILDRIYKKYLGETREK